jgi:hypothetical protein
VHPGVPHSEDHLAECSSGILVAVMDERMSVVESPVAVGRNYLARKIIHRVSITRMLPAIM